MAKQIKKPKRKITQYNPKENSETIELQTIYNSLSTIKNKCYSLLNSKNEFQTRRYVELIRSIEKSMGNCIDLIENATS